MPSIECPHCPRACTIPEGAHGYCQGRRNEAGRIVPVAYGKLCGGVSDPMEKKPLYHFYPGTPVLSFGSVGCNMGCRFCQNAHLSKTGDPGRLPIEAAPEQVAEIAVEQGVPSVAFTYNEPVVWSEFVIDAARACRERGVRTVAVSSGYITSERRPAFFEFIDAANIDLKGFTEDFYSTEIDARLEPVLDTLRYLAKETDCWLEITNLVIPTLNDADGEIERMAEWILRTLGPEVPLHLSAFRPAWRRTDLPSTPPETLFRVRETAMRAGLRYVYTGNIVDSAGQSTYCPQCKQCVILRDGYTIAEYVIDDEGCCRFCGQSIAGRFFTEI